ncbi:hypothetical protein GCM10009839_41640 [Catenulispora yoronensis]|uniref:Serine aminopeptidase S33 domain-containing protein n=1 Tax=Catenulispora yoronensis TaxID=450799 RepID=A0ABN2UH45_9ACTN
MPAYRTGTVRSADGTTIAYRHYGAPAPASGPASGRSLGSASGPGPAPALRPRAEADRPALLVLHGGMKAAQHMADLAIELSDQYEVFVPDRRGRGQSGGFGPDHRMQREVEDVQALVDATGARMLFGHSAGGLISLSAALAIPSLEALAVYEPPLSVRGSAPTDWLRRFDREIASGRVVPAAVTALKGMRTEPLFTRFPRWLLTAVGSVTLRIERPAPGESSIVELVPTIHNDIALVDEMADSAARYAALRMPVLLLGGTKSPEYLDIALDELAAVIPHAKREVLQGLDHQGPEEKDSARVAQTLRAFFNTSVASRK